MSDRAPIVCFGELLVRLGSPYGERLLQSPRFDVHIGGAEANVAVSLARFGHAAQMRGIVPANALGAAAVAELRRHGVSTEGIVTAPGRMGLYFLTPGAVSRPAAVLYDRTASAFALADAGTIDWQAALRGARWLHVSGITSALSLNAAAANQRAADAAVSLDVGVSFDCNYREQLWASAGVDPRLRLRGMLATARVAFADARDIALVLGAEFTGDAAARRRAAAQAAFKEFPRLQRICTTIRDADNVDRQRLSGVLYTRADELHSPTHSLDGIVDRVGAGDAFAAGILHGLVAGHGEQRTLDFAVAAAALKHSVRGDFNLVDLTDVEGLLGPAKGDIRR